MTITAKYPSRCSSCGQQIGAGEKIEWSKGSPVRHTSCPSQAPKRTTRPRTECVACGSRLSQYAVTRGFRRCLDCVDGGGNAHGGHSYTDRHGNFVLGDDD